MRLPSRSAPLPLAGVLLAALAAPDVHAQARYVRVLTNAPEGVVWAEVPGRADTVLGAAGAVLRLPAGATRVRLAAPPFTLSAALPTQRDTALVRLDVPAVRGIGAALEGRPRRYRADGVWIDAAALGVALVATAVSVRYKFEADRQYAVYERTGDPALRPPIETLDRKAGIAFGVGMSGLAVLTVRLALR